MRKIVCCLLLLSHISATGQTDTLLHTPVDTSLRIINFNANFTQHVDSSSVYQFLINKDQSNFYWYLQNAPVGLTINKDKGLLSFKVAKNYFLSGKLKYDYPYRVGIGVQCLLNIADKVDSFFIIFYKFKVGRPAKFAVAGRSKLIIW